MFVFETYDDGRVLLRLSGEIDIELAHQIKPELRYHLTTTKEFLIDGAAIRYIDSSGVSILVLAMQICREANIALTITRASTQLMHILKLARLDGLFVITQQSGPAQPETITHDDAAIIATIKKT